MPLSCFPVLGTGQSETIRVIYAGRHWTRRPNLCDISLDGSQFNNNKTCKHNDNQPPPELTGAFEKFCQIVPEERIEQLLEGHSAFSQDGPLSAFVVLWLMLFQRLHPKGTLAVAMRELLFGPIRSFVRLPEGESPSANTSAYSQARTRLPLAVAEKVSDMIFESLHAQPRTLPGLQWPVFLLDGSSILLQHTEELVRAYPPAENQHGSSHWPVMRVVVAHDVVSGLAVRPSWGPMYGPHAVSEQDLAKLVMRWRTECAVFLGDRNFGVFSMAYEAQQNKHRVLFRLTDARAQKLHGGTLPKDGTDCAVHWTPSRDDLRTNPEIPATAYVDGRLLACKVRGKNGQWITLYLFTTLDLSMDQILELYGYRWNIETDLRSLKRQVRLHMLDVKSAAMSAKELVLGVAAYNLTRGTMNEAASALQLDPRELSFSQAQDTINAALPALANATTDEERKVIIQQMVRVFAQSKLPRRAGRSFPREIWPRPCSFPKRKVATKRKAAKARKARIKTA